MHRRIAVVLAVAALAACLACPQPQSPQGGATVTSPAPQPSTTETTPPVAVAANAEPGAHGSGAISIAGDTLERVSPAGPSAGSRLTLQSTQSVPMGNDGKHDILRLVDACAAAGLAADSDPSLLWLADSDKALDQIQLKVTLAEAVTTEKTIDNPVIVEHSPLTGGQAKVCVMGVISGTATTSPICLTLSADKANNLTRWLQQVRIATTNTTGLDAHRCRLHIGNPQFVADLTFALKP